MNLVDYIKDHGRNALAEAVESVPAYLSQIAHGHRKASPKLALAIERATGGAVSRHELRPDIYPDPEWLPPDIETITDQAA